MALLYAAHWLARMRTLSGVVLASVVLLAFYGYGLPQYFVLPTTLLIYFLVFKVPERQPDDYAGLVAAVAAYLIFLNGFQAWYFVFERSSQVRAFVGLPCFLVAALVIWRLVIFERRSIAKLNS